MGKHFLILCLTFFDQKLRFLEHFARGSLSAGGPGGGSMEVSQTQKLLSVRLFHKKHTKNGSFFELSDGHPDVTNTLYEYWGGGFLELI